MVDRRIPRGDLPPIIILCEAFLLSSIFFGVPLLSQRRLRAQFRAGRRAMGYFACLGLGFIFIEICLIQHLVLFLGAPVYSIATVIGGLLVSAGIGSLWADRFAASRKTLQRLLWMTAAAILVWHVAAGWCMDALLKQIFPVRVIIAVCLVSLLGVLMGMPLPMGIRYLKNTKLDVIPWA